MTDEPVGRFTTTLDMLMHQHPWLAEMLQWRPIESPPEDGVRVLAGHPVNGSSDRSGWVTLFLYEDGKWIPCGGGSIPTPTHWMPVPVAPGKTAWKNFQGDLPKTGN